MLKALRQCLSFLEANQLRRWLWLIPLAIIAACLEVAAAAMVLVLIQLISTPAPVSASPILSLIQNLLPRSEGSFITGFSLLAGLFYVAKNSIRLFEVYMRERCASDTAARICATCTRWG